MRDSQHDRPLELLADRALDLKQRVLSLAHADAYSHSSRTSSSSSTSICEVASSMMMTLVRLRIALAKAISCLSPALSEPPLSIVISKMLEPAPCLRSRRAVRWHLRSTSRHSTLEYCSKGSRLLLTVPENKATSWLIIVYRTIVSRRGIKVSTLQLTILLRRSSNPMVEMSTPSILSRPSSFQHLCPRVRIHTLSFLQQLPPFAGVTRRASISLKSRIEVANMQND